MGYLGVLVAKATGRAIARAVRFYREHVPDVEASSPPEDVKPFATFEGRITLNQLSAAGITGEWEMGEYDPDTGMPKAANEQ